jgi:hypothetical protein
MLPVACVLDLYAQSPRSGGHQVFRQGHKRLPQ